MDLLAHRSLHLAAAELVLRRLRALHVVDASLLDRHRRLVEGIAAEVAVQAVRGAAPAPQGRGCAGKIVVLVITVKRGPLASVSRCGSATAATN